jgi:hypothetical protein
MTVQNQLGLLPPSFGQILWASEAGQNVNLTTTPTEQNNLVTPYILTSTSTSDWQLSGTGRLKYVGTKQRDFLIMAYMSQVNAAYSLHTRIYANSTTALGQTQNDVAYYQTQPFKVSLQPNDYLSIYAWRIAVTLAFTGAGVTAWSFP